jgi:hypothetical protein
MSGMSEGTSKRGLTVGDLVEIADAPVVVSLSWLEGLRSRLTEDDGVQGSADGEASRELASLLGGYSLQDSETRAAFEAITRSLGRSEVRGDAFLVSGVYGSGKSHLLAALSLLVGHPKESWPHFLSSHAGYDRVAAAFGRPRLVVAIPLDEYPATHSLEHVVLSRIEAELARRHGVRVALTEESHLLDLVERYVVPQVGDELDAAARAAAGSGWHEVREGDCATAARVALEFVTATGFPLDWRRSRAEAWAALRRALEANGIDGPVILLDELGMFLAGKDRRGLNADASFLQYVAQRASAERCWLVCVTQRGLEEVGDIDRRTLRQLRDRFRPSFALGLAELGWVVRHRLAPRRDEGTFRRAMVELHADCCEGGEEPFSVDELMTSYPLNPLCLEALQRAAEVALSQTRSAVRLLQEAAGGGEWLVRPAGSLITPDAVFDCFRGEMEMSADGRKQLHAFDVVMANAEEIAPGRESQTAAVMKALCLLGLGEVRWSVKQLRASLVGGGEAELWRDPEVSREVLGALYRYGLYVERARREGEEADEYYADVSSDAPERIRQRLNELVKEMAPDDSRVERAALEACREDGFPLAGLIQARSMAVEWWHARRFVNVICRDLGEVTAGELHNLAGSLASHETKEDGWLFVASPCAGSPWQEEAWRRATTALSGRFAAGLAAWLPREVSEAEREELLEHAALSRMINDATVARPRDREIRARVRERWEESEARARRMLQSAYHEGRLIGADGEAVEAERLRSLMGQWAETLAAIFGGAFRKLFPHFPSIAPERRLAGRGQTNQIIDQFIRPGEVALPPASALEANLLAYAGPLGLMEGEDRRFRLAVKRPELIAAAMEAAPAPLNQREIDPAEVVSYGQLVGRLAKSEWGVTREQCELLVAALIKAGYLVGLDAFLQPMRLEAVAAPLAENLPYVMRGAALEGKIAEGARALWEAATGSREVEWNLPTQERSWSELLAWGGGIASGDEKRRALGEAAEAFGHSREDWSWAEEAFARSEAIAKSVDATLTSWRGLADFVASAGQMPGGIQECRQAIGRRRRCEEFSQGELALLLQLYRLMSDARITCGNGSLLEREREAALRGFRSSEHLVAHAAEVRSQAERWLVAYRRHYVAWHSSAYAAARFEALVKAKQSAAMEAARRLVGAGIGSDEVERTWAELTQALGQRCLTGDPLPAGWVVCPNCTLRLGEEVALPEAEGLIGRTDRALAEQIRELKAHEELLRRRLDGCSDERVAGAVAHLLATVADEGRGQAPALRDRLSEDVIGWIRAQLGQPRAGRRELAELESTLRGKEMTKREVVRRVEEWLGEGDDGVVEVV